MGAHSRVQKRDSFYTIQFPSCCRVGIEACIDSVGSCFDEGLDERNDWSEKICQAESLHAVSIIRNVESISEKREE